MLHEKHLRMNKMIHDSVFIEGSMTRIVSLQTIIVGGGMAGYSAAIDLYDKGVTDIAILLDTREGAASRYGRSDRQSYYKLAEVGNDSDSPYRMAKTLTASGNMDGDNALVEATLSSRSFYRLMEYGIPFQQDEYGALISRGGSSDKTRRMISAGDDTSLKILTSLEKEVRDREIPIYEGYQAVRIVTDEDQTRAYGVIAINRSGIKERHQRFVLFKANHVIMATGGPGGLFFHEGYPRTHFGSTGCMIRAGASMQNLTEFSFGLCAVRKSLIMNGAYQTSLPKYVSTNEEGKDIQEFLLPYFSNPEELYSLQKMKGDQWQFDAKKVRSDGVSIIDLLVYNEIIIKKRHVFLDYRENPKDMPENELQAGETPYLRLKTTNPEAYKTLLDQNMDPAESPIEIYPSMIHHNGGASVNSHYESSIDGLYVIGEAAGSHGSTLPQGASMNQTQVSALRAAEAIAKAREKIDISLESFVEAAREDFHDCSAMASRFLRNLEEPAKNKSISNISIRAARTMIGKRMDSICAMLIHEKEIESERYAAQETLNHLLELFAPTAYSDVCLFFQIEDLLTVEIAVLNALQDELKMTRGSHGSHLIPDEKGTKPSSLLDECFRFSVSEREIAGKIQMVRYLDKERIWNIEWRDARPIPRT